MHKQPHLKLLKKISFLFLIPLLTVSALYAANPLSVELLLPKQKTSSGAVTIVMTNTSDKDIRVLTWNTPLEKNLNADIFTIKNNKSTINYVGVLVKRGKPTEEDYLLFKGGEKRAVTVDLPTYYQMEKEGSYTVTYHGSFKQKTPSKNKTTSKERLKTSQPSVTISFTPTQKKVVSYSQKVSANFNICTQSEIDILNNAHDASIVIARDASDTMDSAEANTWGERYNTWFGAADNTRQNTVKTHFNNIYNALENEQVTFDCNCSAVAKPDETYAYVYPNQHYTIHLCGAFWRAELTGTDSQAGTIVHETSHFTVVAGTDDHVYGQAGAKELAISAPENAIQNADSHEFFAENTPALTMDDPFMTTETIRGIENINLSGTIAASGDKTIYVFSAPRTGLYTFYTSGSLDTQGTLYNVSRSVISYNDDMNASANEYNFKITAKLVQGQTYYLKVNAYGTNTGDYILKSSFKAFMKNDFDGDGVADILWRHTNGQYLTFFMNADGSRKGFKYGYTIPTSWTIADTNDFDGDGIADILWRHTSGQYLTFYMNADGSRKGYKYGLVVPNTWKLESTNDFNADGIADILWRNVDTGRYLIFYMGADGSRKTYKYGSVVPLDMEFQDSNDFDGDGVADILWRNKNNGQYLFFYMNADGSRKAYKYGYTIPTEWTIADTNDFDGDGIADILWRHTNGQYLTFFMNADGSRKGFKYGYTIPTSWTIADTNDFDGDGIADILWRHTNGRYLTFYMNADGSRKGFKYGYTIPTDWEIQ